MNTSQYPELIKVINEMGKYVKDTYKLKLKEKNKIATGKLYNSIDYKIKNTDKGFSIYFLAEKYYINIENGRKPGGKMPPVEAIKRWISIKNINLNKGQSKSGAEFMIARSIQKKGIKANPFLTNAKQGLKDYSKSLNKAFEKDLNINNKLILKKLDRVNINKKYIKINTK